MKTKKILVTFIVLLLILTVTLSGCSKQAEQNSGQNNQSVKLTLMLDWTPNTNHTGLFVAQDKGYFKDQGLEVSIVNPSSQGTLEQLVATGKVDFGISAQEQVTSARLSDLPLVSLATIIQHNTSGFVSLRSKNILTAKDFEGKTYGGWGLPSETAILTALMQKENADFSKINMVNIGETDQLASLNSNIDLTWIFYGWTGIQAEIRGQELNMIWLKDIDPALDYYTPVIVSNEKMIQSNPDTVRKMMQAISAGYEFAIENPEESAKILIKYAPESDPEMIKRSQAWLSPQYEADAKQWGVQKATVWENYSKWLYDNKLVTKMMDSSKAFTNDFLPTR
ncbi:Hydroxymethylpyrimidine ABC transporter, substrate-binding protein component [Dehalobacter sp. UNSWDHB]|jgi:ABC-type nitrate/sulfonate/bicarbonate transport systems, periplasmic components|uniref:ABC transporter substrate-binding protein n=1 Tax=unclassified Dehalobacter TaxID=2635733 RepID=UPI00028B2A58|nr:MULTISPECIES: ABC transporter substrate-binding protein [unclassified Dehalobacter]AFV01380.1 Hydroxymethylpyrimidine ABC transporter, substrate-binding component [Dehalobacter sp. DCA]AFV04418.1 Hydroxymethylpyrimidine ABC transporter, substrate-binding component [Dehalobacter sp. CF]EQB21342.1 Hydroxymethylpyrimidine ABC transporter, substrate-binding protein component [Dehalobacter sp. UNSWDHB]